MLGIKLIAAAAAVAAAEEAAAFAAATADDETIPGFERRNGKAEAALGLNIGVRPVGLREVVAFTAGAIDAGGII